MTNRFSMFRSTFALCVARRVLAVSRVRMRQGCAVRPGSGGTTGGNTGTGNSSGSGNHGAGGSGVIPTPA